VTGKGQPAGSTRTGSKHQRQSSTTGDTIEEEGCAKMPLRRGVKTPAGALCAERSKQVAGRVYRYVCMDGSDVPGRLPQGPTTKRS